MLVEPNCADKDWLDKPSRFARGIPSTLRQLGARRFHLIHRRTNSSLVGHNCRSIADPAGSRKLTAVMFRKEKSESYTSFSGRLRLIELINFGRCLLNAPQFCDICVYMCTLLNCDGYGPMTSCVVYFNPNQML